MNCKQGDLAIVIQSRVPDRIGTCVECIEFAGEVTEHPGFNNMWLVDGRHPIFKKGVPVYCPDFALMPISGYKPDKETKEDKELENVD